MSAEQALAAALWAARQQGGVVPRDAADSITDTEAAYKVQEAVWALADMPRFGWKVGATSQIAQNRLGLSEPATAPLWQPECLESPTGVVAPANQHSSIECEFAFRFATPLPTRDTSYGRDEVLAAVECVMPCIEIVGCRFEGGFGDIGAERLICDMVANKGWIYGEMYDDWRARDFTTHAVTLAKNGVIIAEGTGAEVLGDPLTVLEWTVNHLSARGIGLAAGEVVSTGTCTGIVPVEESDYITADFGDLSTVDIAFEEE